MVRHKVFAVVVAFNPDSELLRKLCEGVADRCTKIIVVDNSENPDIGCSLGGDKVKVVNVGYNSGIARAQNIGIRMAIDDGATMVVFFDQDSTIDNDYLDEMLSDSKGINEVCVRCPIVYDIESKMEYPFILLTRIGLPKKVFLSKEDFPTAVTVGISSGTIVSVKVFNSVGLFNENLFIDYVDTDWFLRCHYHSVPVMANPAITIQHKIGNSSKGRKYLNLHIHSSVRVYYQVRNSIALLFMPHVPVLFAVREISVTLLHKFYQTFYVRNKLSHLSCIAKGVKHGVMRKFDNMD